MRIPRPTTRWKSFPSPKRITSCRRKSASDSHAASGGRSPTRVPMAEKRTVEIGLATSGLDPEGRPVRVPLAPEFRRPQGTGATAIAEEEPELGGEHMLLNLG